MLAPHGEAGPSQGAPFGTSFVTGTQVNQPGTVINSPRSQESAIMIQQQAQVIETLQEQLRISVGIPSAADPLLKISSQNGKHGRIIWAGAPSKGILRPQQPPVFLYHETANGAASLMGKAPFRLRFHHQSLAREVRSQTRCAHKEIRRVPEEGSLQGAGPIRKGKGTHTPGTIEHYHSHERGSAGKSSKGSSKGHSYKGSTEKDCMQQRGISHLGRWDDQEGRSYICPGHWNSSKGGPPVIPRPQTEGTPRREMHQEACKPIVLLEKVIQGHELLHVELPPMLESQNQPLQTLREPPPTTDWSTALVLNFPRPHYPAPGYGRSGEI
ncbi:hypothetical protein EV368DRAFT_89350 [Lentinula lateritia]|nr:hypothetical protein EV368DRAFT_89350 [Lentinula lateritia]